MGSHLAALERQKFLQMSAEQQIALKATAGGEVMRGSQRWTQSNARNRASHWLGDQLISAGERLAEST